MKKIYPNPYYYKEYEDEFVFSDKLFLFIDKEFSNEGFKKLCTELWKNFTAGKCELVLKEMSGLGNFATISKNEELADKKRKTDYEYEIDADKNGIYINYSSDTGMIHAFCTVLQLINPYRRKTEDFSVKTFSIKDKPALKMRGMHLCLLTDFRFCL